MRFLAARLAEDEAEPFDPYGNPARVIADLAAKRAIIALHADDYTDTGDIDTDAEICVRCQEAWPCETLRLFASVYSDHADYRQEWKP